MSQFRGNSGTLIIIVGRAKDLPNKRKLEKQNPYCLLRIANLTDKTNADLRGGQVPRWDEEFRFTISPEISPVLKLSVLDETKKAPTLIAEAEIDFTPVFYSSVKEGYDKWHPLTSGSREAGEIYLEMTFYPASSATVSRKSMSMSTTSSQSPKKRSLPPVPGQQSPPLSGGENNSARVVYSIPPPLPRVNNVQTRLGDSFRASQTSVHSLPDVPRQNDIRNANNNIDDHQEVFVEEPSPPIEKVDSNEDRDNDWMSYAKKLTSKYTAPFFGKPETTTTPTTETATTTATITAGPMSLDGNDSSRDFDQLEREVQSDFEQNGRRHTRNEPKNKPPPVPSHSSGSFRLSGSGGSANSIPPPVPQHSSGSFSTTKYDVIEPVRDRASPSSPTHRGSPTRKPPQSFYKSGQTSPARLDLSSIPYDAFNISPVKPTSQPVQTTGFGEPLFNRNDNDVLLPIHNAPTPADVFGNSSRSRMSPTRFGTSLPPVPPKH